MNQYHISEDESASNYEYNKDLSIPDEALYQGMIIIKMRCTSTNMGTIPVKITDVDGLQHTMRFRFWEILKRRRILSGVMRKMVFY